jgi:hypothetical protein
LWVSIAHCLPFARKTSPGENKNMTDDGNPKAPAPESDDSKNFDGIAKAFIVSVAWSYAEALERTKRSENQQEAAQQSQTQSETEQVDRAPERN